MPKSALDAVASFRAMRAGNIQLANNIVKRHSGDVSDLMSHQMAICLAMMAHIDETAAVNGGRNADDILDNIQQAIMLSPADD